MREAAFVQLVKSNRHVQETVFGTHNTTVCTANLLAVRVFDRGVVLLDEDTLHKLDCLRARERCWLCTQKLKQERTCRHHRSRGRQSCTRACSLRRLHEGEVCDFCEEEEEEEDGEGEYQKQPSIRDYPRSQRE